MKLTPLLCTAAALAALSSGAQAQALYGELGISSMTTSLSVPVLNVSAKAKPTMARAMLGTSILPFLTVEGIAAGAITDDGFKSASGSNNLVTGDAKVNQVLGVYGVTRVKAGPVELFARLGHARTELKFDGVGTSKGGDLSYGAGVRLIPGDNLTLSLDYMNYYEKDGAKVDGYTLSLGYRF